MRARSPSKSLSPRVLALRGIALSAVAASMFVPDSAHAGGFEFPGVGARGVGRGGAYVVGVNDLTAFHYNPAALAKQRGTNVTLHNNFTFHRTTFARAPVGTGLPDPEAAWGNDAGTTFELAENGESLFPFGPFAAVASDFGLENWTFGAAVYGPNAIGKHDYPVYGPQSFQITELDILLAYYTVGAAWKFRDIFGIGATIQYVDLIKMRYGLVVDSAISPNLNPVPDETSTQLETVLDLKDRAGATAQLGVWYRPHRRVELGLSSRIVPVFLQPAGGVEVDKEETVTTDEVTVKTEITLPAILRGGVRYIHDTGGREWFDLELDAVWENWSTVESFDLDFTGSISGQAIQDLSVGKNYRDTVSLRLGGDVHAIEDHLTVRAGGFWENGAMRDAYSHLDFPSFMRGGIGLGLTGGYRGVYLTVGYMHIFQESREVDELTGKVFQQRPLAPCPEGCNGASGVPSNAGRFESSMDILSVGLDLKFDEIIGHEKERRRPIPNPAAPEPSEEAPPNPDEAPDQGPAAPT